MIYIAYNTNFYSITSSTATPDRIIHRFTNAKALEILTLILLYLFTLTH